jgi:hypothetical protein
LLPFGSQVGLAGPHGSISLLDQPILAGKGLQEDERTRCGRRNGQKKPSVATAAKIPTPPNQPNQQPLTFLFNSHVRTMLARGGSWLAWLKIVVEFVRDPNANLAVPIQRSKFCSISYSKRNRKMKFLAEKERS